jgi:hypothetical protein
MHHDVEFGGSNGFGTSDDMDGAEDFLRQPAGGRRRRQSPFRVGVEMRKPMRHLLREVMHCAETAMANIFGRGVREHLPQTRFVIGPHAAQDEMRTFAEAYFAIWRGRVHGGVWRLIHESALDWSMRLAPIDQRREPGLILVKRGAGRSPGLFGKAETQRFISR